MIPVRVPAACIPVLGTDRRFDIAPDHPLSSVECPVCDELLSDGGHAVVLVFVGVRPGDRKPAGYVTGAAVAVHEACALGPPAT